MIWIVVAIIVAGLIIASAINRGGRQKRIDEWYENLPEHKKREHEVNADIASDYDKRWGGSSSVSEKSNKK